MSKQLWKKHEPAIMKMHNSFNEKISKLGEKFQEKLRKKTEHWFKRANKKHNQDSTDENQCSPKKCPQYRKTKQRKGCKTKPQKASEKATQGGISGNPANIKNQAPECKHGNCQGTEGYGEASSNELDKKAVHMKNEIEKQAEAGRHQKTDGRTGGTKRRPYFDVEGMYIF